MDYNSLSCDSE